MTDFLAAVLLGVIEGITEFLPISSTGHLLIAERWLGHRSDLFNIAIQAGAILAMVLIYRQRLWELVVGFATRPEARSYALKLAAAFVATAVLGLVVKKLGCELPTTIRPVAWALVIGAIWMLVAEQFAARRALALGERTEVSWTTAVLVGIAQVIAGCVSRHLALVGHDLRRAAVRRHQPGGGHRFAFLLGIPTMFAATAYELLTVYKAGGIAGEDWTALAVAFVAAMATAFIAVKWLLRYIQTHRFTVFALYRIVLGVVLLLLVPAGQ